MQVLKSQCNRDVITWSHILNENKSLFKYKGHWTGAKNIHMPDFHSRLSSVCNNFVEKNYDQNYKLLIVKRDKI